jgi:hypothetical protein
MDEEERDQGEMGEHALALAGSVNAIYSLSDIEAK